MMNSMRLYILIFLMLAFFSTKVCADLAHRNLPYFSPQRLQLAIEFQSFRADSNFLSDGSKEVLPYGFKFLTYDLVLSTMYDLNDMWAMSADLGLGYAESFNNVDLRNSREIKDLKLGLWRLFDKKENGRFIVDGFYLLNFIKNDLSNDEVSVTDGVSWLQLGVWWEPDLGRSEYKYNKHSDHSPHKYMIRTYLGFRARAGYSDVLIYKIHPQFSYKKFIYGAELNGLIAVIKESEEDRIAKQVINFEYNASVFRYNAWNPNMVEGMVWAGYQSSPYSQVRFGASQVLGLKNVAEGFGFFFEWQTSMTVTPSGLFFKDVFGNSKKSNPRKNLIEIKNYGEDPQNATPKVNPSSLEDL